MRIRLMGSNAVLVLVLALLMGCSNAREQEAKGFVQNYCSILQDAYARADLKLISHVATEKEIKKLFPVIQALTSTDNTMKTEILEFRIKKAKVEDEKATVETVEKWRYWWLDRKTQTLTKPKQEESYRLEYNLVKAGNDWKVDSIKNLDDKQ